MSAQVTTVHFGVDASAVNDDTENDETDDCRNFDDAEEEFDLVKQMSVTSARKFSGAPRPGKELFRIRTFTISTDSEDLDYDKEDEENSNPNANVDVVTPKRDGDSSSRDFKGQYSKPADGVIPAHSETPARSYYYSTSYQFCRTLSAYHASSMNRQPYVKKAPLTG